MISALRHIISALALSLVAVSAQAQAFDTRAKAAFVLDLSSGTVLLEKNADEALPPASMSKLMTLYVAFEALRDGRLDLNEKLPVSQHAMNYGGSTMFLDTTDHIRVEDLLRGIIVLSGNDACAVIAEALSPDGTEAGFARFMTKRAKLLGMTNSTFANSNGWPAAGHLMSVRDLAILASRLISDFPEYYPMFSETEFAFDGRAKQNTRNRNPLLTMGIGADGLKTGHTKEAGYGLVGSAKQGDRRVVFVVSGLDSTTARAEEAQALVKWSFRQFAEKTVAKAGAPIIHAEVWMGRQPTVGLVAAEDLKILLPVLTGKQITAEVVYVGPIDAPISKGQQIAELVITREGLPEVRLPLVADRDVPMGGFVNRLITAVNLLYEQFSGVPAGAM